MLTISAAVIILASSALEAPTPSPRMILDAPDPRAPITSSDEAWGEDWSVPAPAATPAPKASAPKRKSPDMLGRQPVFRGELPSQFATLDLVQDGLPEQWHVTLDGAKVGRLDGNDARVRVGMVRPGLHKLAIFNKRGTLWSGYVELRPGQTLALFAREAGLEASDPMALFSDAERREERVAKP